MVLEEQEGIYFSIINANKYLDRLLDYNPESEEPNPFITLEKPQWIRKVVIDQEKITREFNFLLAISSADEVDEYIRSLRDRIIGDIINRDSLSISRLSRMSRTSLVSSAPIRQTYSPYRDTISRLMDFFDVDSNYENSEIMNKIDEDQREFESDSDSEEAEGEDSEFMRITVHVSPDDAVRDSFDE